MPTTASASIFLGGQWFLPAVVLSMICFVAQPLLMHKDMNLELKRTLEPRVMRGVSGFLCLGRLFQGQPNEAALCI